MASEFAVRRASEADIDRVTAIIALAFADDPLWGRALARPDGSRAHHADFWRLADLATEHLGADFRSRGGGLARRSRR
ncbi:MAG TPA: hypothetical protein VMU94_00740 [Streptosporangiaceae bacterium]|nr:hypothetical protein [Streptosporangiaceae bacterium]